MHSRTTAVPAAQAPPQAPAVAVVIPAYNEAEHIEETIAAVRAQTRLPDRIIVVDDCSSDGTGDIARELGVEVIRTPRNQGTKSQALNYALTEIASDITVNIDADTVLEPTALSAIIDAFVADPEVVLASGYTIPKGTGSCWERGRVVEYLFNIELYRMAQDSAGVPVVSAGCFLAFRTEAIRTYGGFNPNTMAEDMHLTWEVLLGGGKVRFVPGAVCRSADPSTWPVYFGQMNRWYRGFFQNLKLFWRTLHHRKLLGLFVWSSLVDACVFPVSMLIGLYALVGGLLDWTHPDWTIFLVTGLALDLALISFYAFRGAIRLGCVPLVARSIPYFYFLRTVNIGLWYRALYLEVIRGQQLRTWDKGH
ncbi:MAG TPA: glycosyltransferase family 2 protein [bacterium]|jgi:biofilm PGA synthesis N-glycosyltransferase PgaC|nr:glycosyltransferase family 2 protein [bacterium]